MFELNKDSLPYLYQVADRVSLKNQNYYFNLICCYLFLLVVAALISYIWPKEQISIVISLITMQMYEKHTVQRCEFCRKQV